MTSPASRPRDRKERTPPPTKGNRNMGSLMGMLMVMVIASCVVVYGIMAGKKQQDKANTSQTEQESKPVDPFADMTYAYGSQKGKPRTQPSRTGYESTADQWNKARDLQVQAKALIDESSQLRADGDFGWRQKSAAAQDLIEEAYELGVEWREKVIADKGAESVEAKSLDRTLQDWNRTRMQLHKTVGG